MNSFINYSLTRIQLNDIPFATTKTASYTDKIHFDAFGAKLSDNTITPILAIVSNLCLMNIIAFDFDLFEYIDKNGLEKV